jgi:hypothetical protein
LPRTCRAAAIVCLVLLELLRPCPADELPDLMQTLLAEDATLNNNLNLLQPSWSRSRADGQVSFGFGIEKMLSPSISLEIENSWENISPRAGRSRGGFGDVDLMLKYVFLCLPENRLQIALAPTVSFPTDSHIADERSPPSTGLTLTWGSRLSGLSTSGALEYLRAFEVQGDIGYSHPLGAPPGDEIFFDPVIDYSFPFLAYTHENQMPWLISDLCPFLEANFEEPLRGDERMPSLYLMPGMSYARDTFQLSAGIQIAVTREAAHNGQVAAAGSLLIFLDALNPKFAWMPF